jgi:hypothetical protein
MYMDGSTAPVEASFWLRFGRTYCKINHSAATKSQCTLSLAGNKMALPQLDIFHIIHINDLKQCSSIGWVHSACRSQLLAQIRRRTVQDQQL